MQNKIVYSLRRISGLSEAHTVISIQRVRKILSLAERGHLLLLLSEVSVCIDKKTLYFMTILIEEAL